jgi:L-asparaginase
MNAGTLEAAKKAAAAGVWVVRASRVPIGAVLIKGEVDDKQFGTLCSDELNPQKARVLLMLAMLKKRNWDDMQRLFVEY